MSADRTELQELLNLLLDLRATGGIDANVGMILERLLRLLMEDKETSV